MLRYDYCEDTTDVMKSDGILHLNAERYDQQAQNSILELKGRSNCSDCNRHMEGKRKPQTYSSILIVEII
jgi:hypothetical protein